MIKIKCLESEVPVGMEYQPVGHPVKFVRISELEYKSLKTDGVYRITGGRYVNLTLSYSFDNSKYIG